MSSGAGVGARCEATAFDLGRAITVRDFETYAMRVFDDDVAAYYGGGAADEITLRANEAAFDRFVLRPFIGLEADVDLTTSLLGTVVAMPLGIAPTAMHAYAHVDGELATARAAAAASALYCASSSSSFSAEQIAAASAGPRWFQYYGGSATGAHRAADLGFTALVLTADGAVPGYRDREFRANRANPGHPIYSGGSGYHQPGRDLSKRSPRTLTWSAIDGFVDESALPVIVKGVMTAEDADRAVRSGAAAVWVSNHGGRQLDRAPATLDVLVEVVDAVDGRVEVYVDGGFRRGTDVVMALALGATAVFVGRPVLYGLAAAGERGVAAVLHQYRREIGNAMGLLGASRVAELGRRHVASAAAR